MNALNRKQNKNRIYKIGVVKITLKYELFWMKRAGLIDFNILTNDYTMEYSKIFHAIFLYHIFYI